MNLLYYTIKIKNFVKTNFNPEHRFYRLIQKGYRKYIFPAEQAAGKNQHGFESKQAMYMCSLLPKKTLDAIINYYQPKTWLDVGCGTGSALKYVRKKGIIVIGIENSALAIRVSKLGKIIQKHDLTQPIHLQQHFDVAWCYEVAEHLPQEKSDTFINTLVFHGEIIVLSAAFPGQGGDGHINEQPASYWIQKMKNHGFIVDEPITNTIHALDELYARNVHCFKKEPIINVT